MPLESCKTVLGSLDSSNTRASSHEVRTTKRPDVLNRDQTEEWKGILQFTFLMYHYLHTEEVYPFVRFSVSCYVCGLDLGSWNQSSVRTFGTSFGRF